MSSLTAMERDQGRFRILMFPWLAHGHISPFLELSKKLSKTNNFTTYLCSTPVNLDSVRASLVNDASVELVELHLPSSPELPPELHTSKNLPLNLLTNLIQAFEDSSSRFSDIMDSLKPDLLVYDLFQPWAPKLASSKGIPSVYFSTSGGTVLSYYHHLYTTGAVSTFPFHAISLPDHELARLMNTFVPNLKDADHESFAFGNFARSTDIVLVKSCREIELKYIDYLSDLSKKKMVCTGPLIADANGYDDSECSEIMKWLDRKSYSSTLYISFGSECILSKAQIAEIANVLQLCDVNFLWVMKVPAGETNTEEKLPAGFLATVKETGLVVPRWVPQTKILAHPSVAGFVSHCGWSSITESMYYGVPIITMPMQYDQPINARLVVEAGVGVEVEKDVNGLYVAEEVAKAVNKVMVETAFYEDLRKRARRLSEAIREKEEDEAKEAAEELLMICMKNKKYV